MNKDEYTAAIQAYQQNYLEHHGILGQKWGIRRYQNPDGSLTEAGKKRYLSSDGDLNEKGKKRLDENSYYTYLNKKNSEQDTRTYDKDGKPSSIFNKEELDQIKRNEDPELTELMFMELIEHNQQKELSFRLSQITYENEFNKFQKDPYNYVLPKTTEQMVKTSMSEAYKNNWSKSKFEERLRKDFPNASDRLVDAAYEAVKHEEEDYRDFLYGKDYRN